MHENQLHSSSSFLTLTFNDTYLPSNYSVSVRDLQLFNKRLRKRLGSFRFFACGEYGDQEQRPHYHLLVFGLEFHDRYLWRKSASGFLLYRSPVLEEIWPFGHCEVGDVSSQSCGYVARYILGKVNGEPAQEHYTRVHPISGEVVKVKPEFITMSRGGRGNKGGIGSAWYDQYAEDCFPSDFVIVEGQKKPIPRYYKKKLEAAKEANGVGYFKRGKENTMQLQMQAKRLAHARDHASDNTPRRLEDRKEVVEGRVDKLKRQL